MKKLMDYWMLAAMAVALVMGVSGCSDEDDSKPRPEPPFAYQLKLVNEADARLDVDPEALSELIVKIQTNAPQKNLELKKVNEQSWCTAAVKNATEIAVKAGANPDAADREAKFRLVAGASSIEFSITQAGKNPEKTTLSVESDDIDMRYYSYMGDNSGKTVSVKITTNASRWKATTTNMMGEGDGSDWILIRNPRGKSGEVMQFSLTPNLTGGMRAGTIVLSAGNAEAVTIYINQSGMDAATSYKLFTDDKKTKAFADGTGVEFKASYTKEEKERIRTFYVTTNGGYIALVCNPGDEKEVNADTSWLDAGGDLEQLRISVRGNNTTGQERKLDVVIVDSGDRNVLFRIPVVQKAK